SIYLDYHQRVPTQIDRSILLKSVAFSNVLLKADGHFSYLSCCVKHFFQLSYSVLLSLLISRLIRDNEAAL
ncbi:hypothetical protein EKN09_03155, partial [Vibrio penaeicida]